MAYCLLPPVLVVTGWSFGKHRISDPALSFANCVTLSKSLDLSDPQFLFFKTASTIKLLRLLYGLWKKIKGDCKYESSLKAL